MTLLLELAQNAAVLLIGYSIFAVVPITLVNFSQSYYHTFHLERVMGIVLLLALAGIQLIHFVYLQYDLYLIHGMLYYCLLYIIAPTFYLLSKPLLFAEHHSGWRWGFHFLPLLVISFLPQYFVVPLSFLVGAGYLLWLVRSVYALRAQRNRFKLELWVLGGVFLIAVGVALLGLGVFALTEAWFITLYSTAIGCAFLLVNIVLAKSPQLTTDIIDVARETYAVSTLSQVNCDEKLEELNNLMEHDRVYQWAELDLAMLAEKVELSGHQLSELININLGKSFSRYIREYRVNEAKSLLVTKPSQSVLSIGMTVGFTAQSNFYAAFREIVGMTPGQYRKLKRSK